MKIPIVLASDDNYLAPTYITIYSALINRTSDSYYDFYILVPNNISVDKVKYFRLMETKFYNMSISFINMMGKYSDIKMKIQHITSPTYYRLSLPTLIDYEKCIYLDSDIVVCKDLTELSCIELEDYYLAGVLSEGIQLDKIYAKNLCKLIGLKDVKTYINAGVLLMNLKNIRDNKLMDEWDSLAKKAFPAQDQDILNLTCWGKIKILPLKFNTMTKCKVVKNKDKKADIRVYELQEIEEARNNPVIIHYADQVKPWTNRNSLLAEYWWKYYNEQNMETKKFIDVFVKANIGSEYKKRVHLKNKLIRFTQVMGIYVALIRIRDMLKGRKLNL